MSSLDSNNRISMGFYGLIRLVYRGHAIGLIINEYLHTVGVVGSIPTAPTNDCKGLAVCGLRRKSQA